MALTPEGRVKQAVKQYLKRRGIWFYMPIQNGMGQVGIPDFICCWNGRFLAIETKAPGKLNNTTPNQERVIKEIRSVAGCAFVVDSVAMLDELLNDVVWRT